MFLPGDLSEGVAINGAKHRKCVEVIENMEPSSLS